MEVREGQWYVQTEGVGKGEVEKLANLPGCY